MWKEAVAETGIIFYLMLGVGIVGILAKVMNYVTLRKLVNAAGSMSKSTHKLMKPFIVHFYKLGQKPFIPLFSHFHVRRTNISLT